MNAFRWHSQQFRSFYDHVVRIKEIIYSDDMQSIERTKLG